MGSGDYDDACFPGNILIGLIDWDHNIELAALAPGPRVKSVEEEEADFWKKSVIMNYVKPIYHKIVIGTMDTLKEWAEEFKMDNEEGAFTISESKMEDYFPLK